MSAGKPSQRLCSVCRFMYPCPNHRADSMPIVLFSESEEDLYGTLYIVATLGGSRLEVQASQVQAA